MIDLTLLIAIAEIKKKASRHGSMSQRWWQNRIYGLQFGVPSRWLDKVRESPVRIENILNEYWRNRDMIVYAKEAIFSTEMALENPKVSRSAKNNLKGYLNGLRDAKLAIEQQHKEGATK
jgi:hypothetical protein